MFTPNSTIVSANCGSQTGGKCSGSLSTTCLVNGSTQCCATANDCVLAKKGSNSAEDVYCNGDQTGIQTAIGCIHVLASSPEQFLGQILGWAVGIGAGIAFLLILYAGFMTMTSTGNPERLKAGQELLTSAISGLILMILSVFVLKVIGIDILGLCKFGFGPACQNK